MRCDSVLACPAWEGFCLTVPYQVHTALTANGVAFTNCASTRLDGMVHVFDRVCNEHGITRPVINRTTMRRARPSALSERRSDRMLAG